MRLDSPGVVDLCVMTVMVTAKAKGSVSPDLAELRRRYPLTVRNLGALPDREAWLGKIWNLESQWHKSLEAQDELPEVVVKGNPPADLFIKGEFEVIYEGGVLGLLHAAVLATRYGRSVLVIDANSVGRTHRDWNISDNELLEFERVGLFKREELERAVMNRYQRGFVKFHDACSRVKAPPLWVDGVLYIALDADSLLQLAKEKIAASET